MEDILCICQAYSSTKADLIKAHLEGAGIACFLKSDNAGGTLPYLSSISGISIMIHREDAEQALEIIQKQAKIQ